MSEPVEGTLRYSQNGDDEDPKTQSLKIIACDAGFGKYLVIETDRWAFDTIDELLATIKDAATRLGAEGEK